MKNKRYLRVLIIPLIIGGIAALAAIVMLLWNAILPDLFGVGTISFWQALGLFILCKILFGGFMGGRGRKKCGHKPHFRRKWGQMNDEQRQKLKEKWKNHCKWHH